MNSKTIFSAVNDLPKILQEALKQVSYNKKDIGLNAKETESMIIGGGDGQKGFVILVDLAGERHEIHWGSWGGANTFNPNNVVDLDSRNQKLTPNLAVIKGSISGHGTYASISLHPDNLVKMLPAKPELTEKQ